MKKKEPLEITPKALMDKGYELILSAMGETGDVAEVWVSPDRNYKQCAICLKETDTPYSPIGTANRPAIGASRCGFIVCWFCKECQNVLSEHEDFIDSTPEQIYELDNPPHHACITGDYRVVGSQMLELAKFMTNSSPGQRFCSPIHNIRNEIGIKNECCD